MARNINRVIVVGNLTRTRAQAHAFGDGRVLAPHRREHDAQGRVGPVGRQAELLRRHRLGPAGRELRAVPVEGRPIAVDGRLEWREWEAQDGSKRQAVDIVADNVQFLGGRQDSEGAAYVPAGAAGSGDDFPSSPPTTTFRFDPQTLRFRFTRAR